MKSHLKTQLAVLVACVAPCAQAQLLEDVVLRRDGPDAVVQVRFTTPVRLKRVIATGSEDLAQVLYDLVDSNALQGVSGNTGQRRVVGGGNGLPRLTVTDDSVIGTSTTRKMGMRFDKPSPYTVRPGPGDRTIEVVLQGLASQVTQATPVAEKPRPPEAQQRFMITLLSSRDPNLQMDMPVPSKLQDYQVFTERRTVGGQPLYEINLGYFTTQPEAEEARGLLLRRFPKATVVALAARAGGPAAAAETDGAEAAEPAQPRAAAPAAAGASPAVQSKANQLMTSAKAAVDNKDFDGAVSLLNKLLDLPPNSLSREAQELIGFVRSRAGDLVRARTEFELFLKLYPNGPDSDRVRQKLASLPPPAKDKDKDPKDAAGTRRQAAAAVTPPSTTISGSVSQSYFEVREKNEDLAAGVSQNDLAFGAKARQTTTNADFNLRYRDADRDARLVFRDTFTADLLNDGKNRNRLGALYADYKSFSWGTNVRLGRQSPTGGGVFNLFDGIQAGYSFLPKWRVNAVAGVQVDQPFKSKSKFYGLSLDAEALSPNLSGSIYGVTDITDNLTDRRAFGAELRYFSGGASASAAVDYDQFLNLLNFVTAQGSWTSSGGTNINFLYELRAQNGFTALNQALGIPLMIVDNSSGLPEVSGLDPVAKLADLIQLVGTDAARDILAKTTGYTTQALAGFTTPLSKSWQIGADIRLTNIGAIDPVDLNLAVTVPQFQFGGFNGSGNIVTISSQLIGTNLYSRRDTHVLSLQLIAAELFNAVAAAYNNSSSLGDSFQIEPSLRFFLQNDNNGTQTTSVSPGLRLTYQITQKISLESDLQYEYRRVKGNVNGLAIDDTTNSVLYILGGRFDF